MSATLRPVRSRKERKSSSFGSRGRSEEEEGKISSDYCSSGCQSGWTTYFEQSSVGFSKKVVNGEAGEEEDLSMVSDASSGPPQLREEADDLVASYIAGLKKAKNGGEKKHETEASSPLADTATSALFGRDPKFQTGVAKRRCVEGELDFWCRFSCAHLQMSGKGGKN